MARSNPKQVNFRCTNKEWHDYGRLAFAMDKTLSQIIRENLARQVKKHVG